MNVENDAQLKLERDLKCFIAGKWVDSDQKIEVTNPYPLRRE